MPDTTLEGRSAAVLTASDGCFAGTRIDRSGPAVRELLQNCGAQVGPVVVSSDEKADLIEHLQRLVAARLALIVTTGGTGLALRDNTPEATLAVCDRLVPGLPELIRQRGQAETPYAVLSRGVCGIAGRSLLLNLPGSTAGAVHGLRTVLPLLPHALRLLDGHTAHDPVEPAAP